MARVLLGLLIVFAMAGMQQASAARNCPERPPCKGCGCKGGPGYRAPDGKCVSFKNIHRKCGTPPEKRCIFENAPGTGANKSCALKSQRKK